MKYIIRIPSIVIPAFDIEVETLMSPPGDKPPMPGPDPEWSEPADLAPIYPSLIPGMLVDGTDHRFGEAGDQFNFGDGPNWDERVTHGFDPVHGPFLRKQYLAGDTDRGKDQAQAKDWAFKEPVEILYIRTELELSGDPNPWQHHKANTKLLFAGHDKGIFNAYALTLEGEEGRLGFMNQTSGPEEPAIANEHIGKWKSGVSLERGRHNVIELCMTAQSEPGKADGEFWVNLNGVYVPFVYNPFSNDAPAPAGQGAIRWVPESAESRLFSGFTGFGWFGGSGDKKKADDHIDIFGCYITGKAVGE